MKTTKKQIEQIKRLKEKGKKIVEISIKLNLPCSTVAYYFDEKYKAKQMERAKNRLKKLGDTRDKEKYRKYQREYHSKRYKEDEGYREKLKKLNRENQRK
jgi:Asp-tRNA(Asn)/Glu-tRNA(Gln) amidotransferase A subunit family amidase